MQALSQLSYGPLSGISNEFSLKKQKV
jgi:hypothetical protein